MSKRVPKIRFPEFKNDGEWEEKKIGNLINEKIEIPNDISYPLYSLTIEKGIIPKTERYERSFLVKDENKAYKIMEKNDFAINPMNLRFGALARYKNNKKVLVSKYYNIFSCNNKVEPVFFEFYMTSDKVLQYYNRMATGSLEEKKRIHYSEYVKLKIPFPSLKEQEKIADCLSSLDELIEAQNQKVEALKQHKKGLMQQLFPQEGEKVPKLRFPEFENDGEWEEKRIDELFNSYSGGTPSTSIMEYYNGNISFIRSAEINKEKTELFVTEKGVENSSAKYVKKGVVLYALYGANSGEVAISKINGVINQAVLCLTSTIANNYFLCCYLENIKELIINKYIQGGQGNLSGEIIKSLKIRFPTILEQQKIAVCLSSLDEFIEAQNQKVEALKQHKKGLMQQLFPSEEM